MRGVKRYESRGLVGTDVGYGLVDAAAGRLLAQRRPPDCCCDGERLAAGWLDAGCKLHQPVTSFAVALDWKGWQA